MDADYEMITYAAKSTETFGKDPRGYQYMETASLCSAFHTWSDRAKDEEMANLHWFLTTGGVTNISSIGDNEM